MYAILRYQPNGTSVMLRPKFKDKTRRNAKYPFAFMFVGDSFFIPSYSLPKQPTNLHVHANNQGRCISLRRSNTGYHVVCVGYCAAKAEKYRRHLDARRKVVDFMLARQEKVA